MTDTPAPYVCHECGEPVNEDDDNTLARLTVDFAGDKQQHWHYPRCWDNATNEETLALRDQIESGKERVAVLGPEDAPPVFVGGEPLFAEGKLRRPHKSAGLPIEDWSDWEALLDQREAEADA